MPTTTRLVCHFSASYGCKKDETTTDYPYFSAIRPSSGRFESLNGELRFDALHQYLGWQASKSARQKTTENFLKK
jgi:hypothetical protein